MHEGLKYSIVFLVLQVTGEHERVSLDIPRVYQEYFHHFVCCHRALLDIIL